MNPVLQELYTNMLKWPRHVLLPALVQVLDRLCRYRWLPPQRGLPRHRGLHGIPLHAPALLCHGAGQKELLHRGRSEPSHNALRRLLLGPHAGQTRPGRAPSATGPRVSRVLSAPEEGAGRDGRALPVSCLKPNILRFIIAT